MVGVYNFHLIAKLVAASDIGIPAILQEIRDISPNLTFDTTEESLRDGADNRDPKGRDQATLSKTTLILKQSIQFRNILGRWRLSPHPGHPLGWL